MTLAEIEALAAGGESETLELKKSTGEVKTGVKSPCAMLNHRGGRVLFGVTRAGQVIGQHVTDETIEKLVGEVDRIDPPVFPSVDRVAVQDAREVVAVTVPKGPSQPYSHDGKAWRRVGNTNRGMTQDEYGRVLLEHLHGQRRWENGPALEWTVDDLDASEISRTLDEAVRRQRAEDPGTRDPMELLRGFGLIDGDRILLAAVVLFGRSERVGAEYPQCMLRVARFRGTSRTDEFLDNRQFHGNAFTLLRRGNSSSVRTCPSPDVSSPACSNEWMIRSTRRRLCVRPLQMPSATVTTPSAEARWRRRSTTIASR